MNTRYPIVSVRAFLHADLEIAVGIDGSVILDGDFVYNIRSFVIEEIDYFCSFSRQRGCAKALLGDDSYSYAEDMIGLRLKSGFVLSRIVLLQRLFRERQHRLHHQRIIAQGVDIARRYFQRRVAWDGVAYTFAEFAQHYGREHAWRCWIQAGFARMAWDEQFYAYGDFVAYYGPRVAMLLWNDAPSRSSGRGVAPKP